MVLFLGGNAPHNREAARFLAEEVAPALGPGLRLLLAGRCASPRRFGAQALGWVDDLGELFAAADVAVNPVAEAGGSSVKVTDFLAAGLPVLATREGARGHEGASGLRVVSRERFAAELDRAAEWARGPVEPPPTWTELGARVLAELDALS